jgi:hypothetical protein
MVDTHQTPCFPHSAPLGDVLENGHDLFLRHPAVKKNRPLAFGKLFPARQTIQQPSIVIFSIPGAHADIIFAPNAMFFAVFIQAAKVFQVIHDRFIPSKSFVDKGLRYGNGL